MVRSAVWACFGVPEHALPCHLSQAKGDLSEAICNLLRALFVILGKYRLANSRARLMDRAKSGFVSHGSCRGLFRTAISTGGKIDVTLLTQRAPNPLPDINSHL